MGSKGRAGNPGEQGLPGQAGPQGAKGPNGKTVSSKAVGATAFIRLHRGGVLKRNI